MKSVCFVIPYFGKEFPNYFSHFLKSARWNNTVDFIFFTDIPGQINFENIKFIAFNLDQFNSLASEKLNIDVNISEGYKLCDFKPAYGFLFRELVEGYDFWGHGDVDVIYGNIRNFISDERRY